MLEHRLRAVWHLWSSISRSSKLDTPRKAAQATRWLHACTCVYCTVLPYYLCPRHPGSIRRSQISTGLESCRNRGPTWVEVAKIGWCEHSKPLSRRGLMRQILES
nr:hypothetical protein CFP56_43702 [Quercus suber]